MTQARFRHRLGVFLVIAHFALILFVVGLTVKDKFTFDEMFTTFGVLGPLFAAYTTAIIKSSMRDQVFPGDSKKVPPGRSFFGWFVPIVFVGFVLAVIYWKAFGALAFDGFVKTLTVTETLFGVYVGFVVEAFFGPIEKKTEAP